LIEEIEDNAFHRVNNIGRLSLLNSRIRNLNNFAFRDMFNIDILDLRGNYLTHLNELAFESLVGTYDRNYKLNDSKKQHERILFEQNPIHCDCALLWAISDPDILQFISLPEICAGPKGYDCLRISELNSKSKLPCSNDTETNKETVPCNDLVFDLEKNKPDKPGAIYSVQAAPNNKPSSSSSSSGGKSWDYYSYDSSYYNDDMNYYDINLNNDQNVIPTKRTTSKIFTENTRIIASSTFYSKKNTADSQSDSDSISSNKDTDNSNKNSSIRLKSLLTLTQLFCIIIFTVQSYIFLINKL
jgi:hypothetical protein